MPDMPEVGDGEPAGGGAPAASAGSHSGPGVRDVFISYASLDSAIADSVCAALERAGMACWIAPRDVTPGEFYAEAIVHAIDSAKVVVLVLSQHAAASPHVLREVERGSSKRHPVVSLRIDPSPIPAALEYFLNSSQWLDASAVGVERALPRLVDAVRSGVRHASDRATERADGLARPAERHDPQPAVSAEASRPARLRLAAGIALVVIALAWVAVGQYWRSTRTPSGKRPAAAAPAGPSTTAVTQEISDKSVAVLPFTDLSERKDEAYFADGLTAELIDRLANVSGFRVPAATSSFYFKGKQASVGEIARALGVRHVVEGSVRKAGNTLRITAQLIRADSGYHVWSQTFDRPLNDVFKVQDEIAGAVAQALQTSILAHVQLEPAPTASVEAYTLYLRALARGTMNGLVDYDAVATDVRAALALDPQFASAWALYATSTIYRFDMRGRVTPEACATARGAADHALKLKPTLPAAHRARGIVIQHCDANLPEAEVEFRTALELEPGDSLTLRGYSWLALQAGRTDQALQLAQRSLAADPLNPWSHAAVGDAQFAANRLAEAETAYRKAAQIDPLAAGLHGMLANILLTNHKAVDAVTEAEAEPDADWREQTLPFALDAAGRRSDADRAIAAYQRKHADDAGEIAAFYACRHDADRSIHWLETFAAQHSGAYDSFAYRRECFRNLASDARYRPLRERLKLP
jgi:TolB-like protein